MEKMLTQMKKALNKKRIAFKTAVEFPIMIFKISHPTIGYDVDFTIRIINGTYDLSAICYDWEFEFDSIERKTPQAIINRVERIMKNLPRTLDGIRMAQYESAMDF